MARATPQPGPPLAERLRAVGWLLDDRGLRGISLAIGPGGIALTARRHDERDAPAARLRLDAAQVATLCRYTRARRGRGGLPTAGSVPSRLAELAQRRAPLPPLSDWIASTQRLPYREVLRVVGADLDRRGVRSGRIDDYPGGIILGTGGEPGGADVERVEVLPRQHLIRRIADAVRQRGQGTVEPYSQ